MKRKAGSRGQALIEYIIIFSFMAIIAVRMVTAINGYLTGTMGNLAFYLSQQLSVGVCEKLCFLDTYGNRK